MVKKYFFTKNYTKRRKIVDVFNFFQFTKKVTYYHCKIFKSFFYNKRFNLMIQDRFTVF